MSAGTGDRDQIDEWDERCEETHRRREQCRGFNADRAHQVAAGRVRAGEFTPAHQSQAGQASFSAFSARWRAEQGLPPLSVEDARRYVRPALIRRNGIPLEPALQQRIYRAWCAGYLFGVLRWIYEPEWAAEVDAAIDRAARGIETPPLW